jgi:hypothetical protein
LRKATLRRSELHVPILSAVVMDRFGWPDAYYGDKAGEKNPPVLTGLQINRVKPVSLCAWRHVLCR